MSPQSIRSRVCRVNECPGRGRKSLEVVNDLAARSVEFFLALVGERTRKDGVVEWWNEWSRDGRLKMQDVKGALLLSVKGEPLVSCSTTQHTT